MKTYVNTSSQTRHWLGLTRPDSLRTLELAPGEEAELDLPDNFTDHHLKPTTPVEVEPDLSDDDDIKDAE